MMEFIEIKEFKLIAGLVEEVQNLHANFSNTKDLYLTGSNFLNC